MAPIDIAIIDSGVNPWHSHVGHVEEGATFFTAEGNGLVQGPDFLDEIGHGTAIAGLIREKAPSARFHVGKIFKKSLRASMASLLGALEWAVKKEVKLIHLSLGSRNEYYRDTVEQLCRDAFEKGIILVAASTLPDASIFPAEFDTVIGVYWNRNCDEETLVYHPDSPVEFGAHGSPRPIPGRPQELNFRGSSFAAARVTARVAALIEQNLQADCEQVRKILAGLARTERLHGFPL